MQSSDQGSSCASVIDSSSDTQSIDSCQTSSTNFSASDILIAMIGQTGTGKTSFANRLIGIDGTGVGHSLLSCTTDITTFRYQSDSYSVVLIDTPGFNDTTMTDYEVLRRITDWLSSTYRRSVTLSGVLYFHRISDNRMTNTERRNIDMFRSLVGNKALMNVIIVSTMWDLFITEVGVDMEAKLVSGYWKEMIDKKARVMRHYNDTASARSIVGMLLEMTRSPLLVQEEMIKQGKSLPETSVGRRFATWVTDLRKMAQKTVFKLEKREKVEGPSATLRQEIEAQRKIKAEAEEFEQGLATRFRRWIGMGPSPAIPAPVPAEGAQHLRPQISSLPAIRGLQSSRRSVPPMAQSQAPQISQANSTSSNTSTIPSPIHSMSRSDIPAHCLKCLKWVKTLPKSGLPDSLDELVTLGSWIADKVQKHWPEERAFGYPLVHLTWFALAICNRLQSKGEFWSEDRTDPIIQSCLVTFHSDFLSIRVLIEEEMKRPPKRKLKEQRLFISVRNESTSATCLKLASHIKDDINNLHLGIFKTDATVRSLHQRVTDVLLPVRHEREKNDEPILSTTMSGSPVSPTQGDNYELIIDMLMDQRKALDELRGFMEERRSPPSLFRNCVFADSNLTLNIDHHAEDSVAQSHRRRPTTRRTMPNPTGRKL